MLNIDNLIKESLKSGDRVSLDTYKLIKAKIQEFRTQKNAPEYNEQAEVTLLQKMAKERSESIQIYTSAGRMDLADKERGELSVIEALLPKPVTQEDIENYVMSKYPDGIERQKMGLVIKEVKSALVGSDGSIVANVVKSHLL